MTELVDQIPVALRRPVRLMLAVKSGFVSVACLIMAFTFLCVVVLRYGFQADLFAYEEWLLVICFWLYFMGSALGTYENTHVNADLLDHLTDNPRLSWLRAVVVGAIELAVSLVVVYWAVLMIQDEVATYPNWQATIALKIPFVVPRIAVLVGFVLMAFYSSLRLYVLVKLGPPARQDASAARGRDPEAISGGGS